MARHKKLIGYKALRRANEMLDTGVPMTKVHTLLALDLRWSYVSTSVLLLADREGLHQATRPSWLQENPLLQEAPAGWRFAGVFPDGNWVQTALADSPLYKG